jgi:hypothetical protein
MSPSRVALFAARAGAISMSSAALWSNRQPAAARSTKASGRCRIRTVMDTRRRIELNSGCGQLLPHLAEVFNQHDEADHQACDGSEYQ